MSRLPEGYELRDGADPVAAHAYLTHSYWAQGVSLAKVETAFEHSRLVSIWCDGEQVAMARLLTDYASFAYLNDVYVLADHAGKGLAGIMIDHFRSAPDLQDIGRWALYTKDAQSLYERYGWRQYPWPERMMIIDPQVFPE